MKRFWPILLLFISALSAGKPEYEVWLTAGKTIDGGKGWSISVQAQDRWRDHATTPYFQYIQVGLAKELPCGWSISPIYRHVARKRADGWLQDPTPMLDIIKELAFDGWNRSRFEWNTAIKEWRYRNCTQLLFPSFIPRTKIYISDEIFLLSCREFTQNRFRVGLCSEKLLPLNPCFGYILRSVKERTGWKNDHIMDIGIDLPF